MPERTPDYSLHFRLDPSGKVETWTTPNITQMTAAEHIAALKVDGQGKGAAFSYLVACIGTCLKLSKGFKPSLLYLPDNFRM